MSLEEELHALVRGLPGVSIVYAADPVWRSVVKAVGAMLGPGSADTQMPFVVCQIGDGGDEGPAGGGRGDVGSGGGRQVMTVRIRIGTDGSVPAPALARAVAAAIRAHVAGAEPGVDVVAAVEIAAIGV
ncbi:hypothetical protein AL755_02130 (plasmid) [Arthrobacter sp. ERGS1:01]|uniref:hypothetical protein n=1 Tax=Arthrobacter sp. ERGS1:01 TaxID=1704044 RepID=UPI0006B520E1|nr:hypothetical protein [Arthrobacter sp. ERGS1:01]ALE04497.1 hypothetical protein AL755_02130 [Arthrobacter sp. ERGS1:01]